MRNFSCNIYNEILVASKSPNFMASVKIFAYSVDLKVVNDTYMCNKNTLGKYFETLLNERFNDKSENNVLAAWVELLQVSDVTGDYETATPLTFNRYSAYLQQLYPYKDFLTILGSRN